MNDKPKDDNDLLQEGTLTADPTDDCDDMKTPPGAPEPAGKDGKDKDKVEPLSDVFDVAWESMTARADGKEPPIKTPWETLDTALGGGIYYGELIPVVGNTGIGKTQWAMEIAYYAAKAGHPVYYVAMESDEPDLVSRLMGLEYRHQTGKAVSWSDDLYKGRKPKLLADVARDTRNPLRSLSLYFIFGHPLEWHPSSLEDSLASHEAEEKRPLVIVDFLQLVGPDPDNAQPDPRNRIMSAAYYLRIMAKDYNATVLAISSTARNNYDLFDGSIPAFELGKTNPKKLEGSGKEAGEIEYAAATIIALCRERGEREESKPVWVAVVKARFGKTGWVGALPYGEHGFGEMKKPGQPKRQEQSKTKPATKGGDPYGE